MIESTSPFFDLIELIIPLIFVVAVGRLYLWGWWVELIYLVYMGILHTWISLNYGALLSESFLSFAYCAIVFYGGLNWYRKNLKTYSERSNILDASSFIDRGKGFKISGLSQWAFLKFIGMALVFFSVP